MHILYLLSSNLTRWILLSLVISTPIARLVMDKWLLNFAYAVSINGWVFIIAGIITILLAWTTISLQSWKAAKRNPVDALRYE